MALIIAIFLPLIAALLCWLKPLRGIAWGITVFCLSLSFALAVVTCHQVLIKGRAIGLAAAAQAIGKIPGEKFRDAGKSVSHALNRAQPSRPRPERHQQGRQNRRGNLVAPVAEQTRQTHAERSAVEPGFRHTGMEPQMHTDEHR